MQMVDIRKDIIDLRKRILIVDDELFNRMSIKIVLKAAGIQNVDELLSHVRDTQRDK